MKLFFQQVQLTSGGIRKPRVRHVRTALTSATEAKLCSFATLQKGWHYGSGGPIGAEVLQRAKSILRDLARVGFRRTDVFAGQDFEVLVTAYRRDHYISVIVEPDMSMRFVHEKADQVIAYLETDSTNEIVEAIRTAAREIWNTSASYIRGTSITSKVGSTTWRSRTLEEAGSPSSSWTVPQKQAIA